MYKLGKIISSCLAYIVAEIIIVMGFIGTMFITPVALVTHYNKKQSETEGENTENVSNNENEEES